jgi:4'-phosphopantetheinyl transferase EntD
MALTRPVQLTLTWLAFTPAKGKDAWLSHHRAGREAMRLALEIAGVQGAVVPHPDHGYLQLTQGDGEPVKGAFLNLSHTEGMAVAAVSPAPVGIDVESLARDPSKALARMLSERDRKNLMSFPRESSPAAPELLLWTAKEAFAKALGLGMQVGMDRLEIDLLGKRPYPARTEAKGHLPLDEPRIHWEIRGDFLVTLCTEASALAGGIQRLPG